MGGHIQLRRRRGPSISCDRRSQRAVWTVRSPVIEVQTLESLELGFRKLAQVLWAEGHGRGDPGAEELWHRQYSDRGAGLERGMQGVAGLVHTELAALSKAIKLACTTSSWIPTPQTFSCELLAVHSMY